ncbi:ABC transporter permease [Arthrobacter sp. alpha11c]
MTNRTERGFLRAMKGLLLELWLPVIAVALWLAISASSKSPFFPPLQTILTKAVKVWITDSRLTSDLVPSLLNLLMGYGIAVLAGVLIGTALGLMPMVLEAIEPELEFLRAVPAVAILPIAIIAMGLGDDMRIAVIAFGAVWPVLLNTIAGIRALDPVVKDMSTAFSLSAATRLFVVRLPSAAPQIFAGARTALSIAVVLIVVSEMTGAHRGVGYFILAAQRNYAITDMWTGMLVLGILGYLLNLAFRILEGRLLHWHPSYRTQNQSRGKVVSPKTALSQQATTGAVTL